MHRELLDASSDILLAYARADLRLVFVNAAFERVFGARRAPVDASGAAWLDAVHEADRAAVSARLASRAQGGAPAPLGDFRIRDARGAIRILCGSIRPFDVTSGDDAGSYWLESLQDVTEARLAALRESEDHLARMSEAMDEVFFIVSADHARLHYVNDAFERIWGHSREALAKNPRLPFEHIHPDDRARIAAAVASHSIGAEAQPSKSHEFRIVRPDGTIRWVLARTYALRDEDGVVRRIAGIDTDITERKEAELALRISEERLRRMSETVQDVFFVCTVDRSRFLYVNAAFERIWGYPAEAIYKNPRLFLEAMHPEDRERIAEIVATHARTGTAPPMVDVEYRIRRADGALRWIHSRSYAIVDDDGVVRRIVGLNEDVTDRKEAERVLRERTEQLERSLREKDVLLAEVHHRVKNNLQAISGLVHLMASQASRRPFPDTIEELDRRIHAMALVHETLYRSHDLAAVDMQAYLGRLGGALVAAMGSMLRIELVVCADGVALELDTAVRCGFIANELVSNALKHAFRGRAGGRVDIALWQQRDTLSLRVADDGVGLPADLDFESEHTLGLRMVAGLAEQMGGVVRRAPGKSAIEVVWRPALAND